MIAEIINLRAARKREERKRNERRAETSRLAHGIPRHQREQDAIRRDKADRDLDGHRRDDGGAA